MHFFLGVQGTSSTRSHHQKNSQPNRQRNNVIQQFSNTVNKLNQSKRHMQDSLELPSDYDDYQVGNLLSPPPPNLDSKHTTPPHSLAYSNSTCAKDKLREINIRSPLDFEESPSKVGIIKTNNQNYPLNQQRIITISPQKESCEYEQREVEDRPATRSQCTIVSYKDKKIQPKQKNSSKSPPKTNRISPQANQTSQPQKNQALSLHNTSQLNQRKTIEKGESSSASLKKRIKQLQQALHMETVISEELRTKLSVTNSLLESKMKEQGLGYLFTLKNTSRDMKNIDIFIELTNLQKNITEKNIIVDRLKNQIKQLQLENQKLKARKVSSPIIARSPNKTLNEELEKLIEEKQSLMGYIDEQKATLKRKIQYIAELEQEINRISDKQAHYTNVERPKIINQLSELKLFNRDLKEELERVRMQLNLSQIKAASDIQQFQQKLSKTEEALVSQQKLIIEFKSGQAQSSKVMTQVHCQKDDIEKQILIKELTLLKNERDYYLSEYRKRTNQSAMLYSLQLKLAMLEGDSQ